MKERGKISSEMELPHGWIVLPSKRNPNRNYYFNTKTKVSTWTRPEKIQEEKKNVSKIVSQEVLSTSHKLKTNKDPCCFKKVKIKYSNTNDSEADKKKTNLGIVDCNKNQKFSHTTSYGFDNFSCKNLKPSKSDVNSILDYKATNIMPKYSGLVKTDSKDTKSIGTQNMDKMKNKKNCGTALDLLKLNYSEESICTKKNSENKEKDIKVFSEIKMPKNENIKKLQKHFSNKKIEMLKNNNHLKSDSVSNNLINSEKLKYLKRKLYQEDKTLEPESTFQLKSTKEGQFENQMKACQEIRERESNNINIFSTQIKSTEDISNAFTEQMDWEPCDEKTGAKNIDEFLLQTDSTNYMICDAFKTEDLTIKHSEFKHYIAVLDTNILVSCLSFIKELRDFPITGLGLPVFYIPWRVLQELDHFKNMKNCAIDKQLHLNARRAISYLNENFKLGNKRFLGQSIEDFSKISDNYMMPDDEILKTCLHLKTSYANINVLLLSNDKNLESKARISNIETYSKEGFQNKYMLWKTENCNIISESSKSQKISEVESTIIDIFCSLKNALKDFLSLVIETEMKEAFDTDWIKICYKKPPWSLRDTLNCIIKHWRSVFFLVFDKKILMAIEDLHSELPKANIDKINSFIETISNIKKLLESIKNMSKKEKPYLKSIDGILQIIWDLNQKIDSNTFQDHTATVTRINPPLLNNSEKTPDDMNENFNYAKNMFKWIWDSLKDYCDALAVAMNSPLFNNSLSASETKLNALQKYNELSKLITFLENVLQLRLEECSASHPVICHFSDFLNQALSVMNVDLQLKLPQCLAVFFSSSEGRNLISQALSDFREFSQILIRVNEFIDRTYCSS